MTKPKERTTDDINYIQNFLRNVNAFKRYPKDLRDELAEFCEYQYLKPGVTVIREGHKPYFLYYVISGELQIIKKKIHEETGKTFANFFIHLDDMMNFHFNF